eukprot:8114937-Pyramimonas_sp.AAC.1
MGAMRGASNAGSAHSPGTTVIREFGVAEVALPLRAPHAEDGARRIAHARDHRRRRGPGGAGGRRAGGVSET